MRRSEPMDEIKKPLEITLEDGITRKEVEAVLMAKEPFRARAA